MEKKYCCPFCSQIPKGTKVSLAIDMIMDNTRDLLVERPTTFGTILECEKCGYTWRNNANKA